MTEPTTDQVPVAGAARVDRAIPTAVARRLPVLHPLDLRHTVIAVSAEIRPKRHDLVAGEDTIGTLLTRDWPFATAVSSDAVWRLTSERRGLISRIGLAHDATTGHAVAAYYPGLLPGGTIALHDTYFRLKLPFGRSGWWLYDEDDQPAATFESACAGKTCVLRDWTIRLQQRGRDPHPDTALVLLTAVWVIAVTLSVPFPVMQ